MTIKNVANFAPTKKFIVAREVDGEYWFYDAWDDFDGACTQAEEINGVVIANNGTLDLEVV